MRILLLCHAFNSLTQRLFVELREDGHDISVEFDINDSISEEAVSLLGPNLIIAPFLKRAIPESIWRQHTCLVVHPGIVGDRGPSALDWAILNEVEEWGVTVLQANAQMDGGDIWASATFPMRDATKASLYRNEVTEAAVKAVFEALNNFKDPDFAPLPLANAAATSRWQPLMQQADRAIDWAHDDTETVLRKIRCADGFPGVRSVLNERELFLYDARPAANLKGQPGEIIARNDTAIAVATRDSAVWIGHIRDKQSDHPFKLPATLVLEYTIAEVPFVSMPPEQQPIRFEQVDGIGYLSFDFYNGAMSTEQCTALREALIDAKRQECRVVVLAGGDDYWSNGMHLNRIEAAASAADESWRNINAIDDLALEIIDSPDHYIITAMQGNAGAGGVFLARAADEVWARKGVILNPHYKDMGNLYGSEYWTYLLPRHAGEDQVERISRARLPMGTREAVEVGLVDRILDTTRAGFRERLDAGCMELLNAKGEHSLDARLQRKRTQRAANEAQRPLADYRADELEHMQRNFYGFDPSYHVARYNFVYKIAKSRTPLTIARHRRTSDILRRVS